MAAMLRPLPALAGLVVLARTGAELAGHRTFTPMVGRDVQALRARAAPRRAGVVTEEMLAEMPEPVRRYLRYTGVIGRPFPGTIPLRQKGQMRPGPGQPRMRVDAEKHYSVQPPGFVSAGTVRVGPLAVGRARDMYAEGKGADAGQGVLAVAGGRRQRRADGPGRDDALPERDDLVPRRLPGGQYLLRAADDSSARVTLTDHGRTATGTLVFDKQGRLTGFVAKRYRTADASSPETWSTPVTGYGEFEGLRLPARGKAIYRLPGGDLEYIV